MKECSSRPSAVLASIVGLDVAAKVIAPIFNHFVEQRTLNGILFTVPVRPIWVRSLAELIEPKVTWVARDSGARPLLGAKLVSQLLAEMQIVLVANCLALSVIPTSEAIAEAVIASSRAMLGALWRPRSNASLFMPT